MLGSSSTRSTGIHVDGRAVYGVELVRQRQRVSLAACAAVELPTPMVLPEALAEDDARHDLARALHRLRRAGLRGKRPFFALAGTASFVKRRFRLPGDREAETRSHLLWEAEQFLDEDVAHYVIDTLITERHGFVIAARQEILDLYAALCRGAGIDEPGFDMASFALCNALECSRDRGQRAADDALEVILHLEAAGQRAVLLRGGVYEAESQWTAPDDDGTACAEGLRALLATELDPGETVAGLWLAGPGALPPEPVLAPFAERSGPIDPFTGLTVTDRGRDGLLEADLPARTYAIAAGLAFRGLSET